MPILWMMHSIEWSNYQECVYMDARNVIPLCPINCAECPWLEWDV